MIRTPYLAGALVIGLSIINLSCSSPDESELPLAAPAMTQPVVTGLNLTNEMGADCIGVWGSPSDGFMKIGDGASFLVSPPQPSASLECHVERVESVMPLTLWVLANPYPNPSIGMMNFHIAVPRNTKVDLWLVRARWREDKGSDNTLSAAGAVTVAPSRMASYELLHGREMSPGIYRIQFPGLHDGTVPAPGFYRVYLRVDDGLLWHDILFYTSDEDLPTDLRRVH